MVLHTKGANCGSRCLFVTGLFLSMDWKCKHYTLQYFFFNCLTNMKIGCCHHNSMYYLSIESVGMGQNVESDYSEMKISGVSCSERKPILFDGRV